MKNIWIFASGSEDGWWSWAKVLLERIEAEDIDWVENVLIVSNHAAWWPFQLTEEFKKKFDDLDIWLNFHHVEDFPKRGEDKEFSDEDRVRIIDIYRNIYKDNNLDYVFLSGWIKHVLWLDIENTINIHPGPIQEPYWGLNLYGQKVHEKVWEDYQAWKIKRTCVTMHFVNDELDRGQVICQIPVELEGCKSTKDVKERVNAKEHEWQWQITRLVIRWEIHLDESWKIHYPEWFPYRWEIDLVN